MLQAPTALCRWQATIGQYDKANTTLSVTIGWHEAIVHDDLMHVLFVNGVATPVNLVVPHRMVQFRIDNPTGTVSFSVVLVVGGQSSSSRSVVVAPPSVSTVDIYDPTVLPPAVQAADACFAAITDISQDAIFQFQGQNFGDSLVLLNVTVSNGTYSGLCVPCFARHTTARCKTSVSRGITYNVSLTLAGQSSGRVTYAFPALVDTTPPFVSSVDSVTSGRSQLATIGGDTIVIVGTRLGANCSVTNASVGVYPLALSVCNSTTIVATTPAGAGVMGVVTVLVSGVSAVVGGGASAAFVYRPPALSGLVTGGGCSRGGVGCGGCGGVVATGAGELCGLVRGGGVLEWVW